MTWFGSTRARRAKATPCEREDPPTLFPHLPRRARLAERIPDQDEREPSPSATPRATPILDEGSPDANLDPVETGGPILQSPPNSKARVPRLPSRGR